MQELSSRTLGIIANGREITDLYVATNGELRICFGDQGDAIVVKAVRGDHGLDLHAAPGLSVQVSDLQGSFYPQ